MKFRMVDAIVSWEPNRAIRGIKAGSFEEYMLRDRLGCSGQSPESFLLGSMVQLAAWLKILSSNFTQITLPDEFGKTRFLLPVGPGQRMTLDLIVLDEVNGLTVATGQGRIGDRLAMDIVEIRLREHNLANYYDPEDLRVLFSEIHRPKVEGAS